jgi:hypothetical protein
MAIQVAGARGIARAMRNGMCLLSLTSDRNLALTGAQPGTAPINNERGVSAGKNATLDSSFS